MLTKKCLITFMSAEKIISVDEKNFSAKESSEEFAKTSSPVVDINQLLARVRTEKQEENKVNLIFIVLLAALVLMVGIFLSI